MTRIEIENNICREAGPLPDCFSSPMEQVLCLLEEVGLVSLVVHFFLDNVDNIPTLLIKCVQLTTSFFQWQRALTQCERTPTVVVCNKPRFSISGFFKEHRPETLHLKSLEKEERLAQNWGPCPPAKVLINNTRRGTPREKWDSNKTNLPLSRGGTHWKSLYEVLKV